jgi:ABC-type phosphate/phosphonate transport system substrate-binding protein
MYDFPEVQNSTEKLLVALVEALESCNETAHVQTPDSSVHAELMKMWRSKDMVLSQSCGLPFMEELHQFVNVIGTPTWTGVSDERGRYQTVIVVREALGISSIAEVRGLRPVVSNTQSLSGWCSLGVALSEVTTEPSFVQPFTQSGGHATSLQMLQDNEADIASIDSATFRLLSRHRPELANGVRVIGYGPLVPATPIIVSKSFAVDADELYRVVSGVFGRSDLRASLADIGISGFVRLAASDYDGVMDLVKIAEVVLPRK